MNFEKQALQHCVPDGLLSGSEVTQTVLLIYRVSIYVVGLKFKMIVSSLRKFFDLGSGLKKNSI